MLVWSIKFLLYSTAFLYLYNSLIDIIPNIHDFKIKLLPSPKPIVEVFKNTYTEFSENREIIEQLKKENKELNENLTSIIIINKGTEIPTIADYIRAFSVVVFLEFYLLSKFEEKLRNIFEKIFQYFPHGYEEEERIETEGEREGDGDM